MLDWMTLDSDPRSTYHLQGTSNPVYTVKHPAVGHARSMDDGREDHRGTSLPGGRRNGEGVGQGYLAECGLVRTLLMARMSARSAGIL